MSLGRVARGAVAWSVLSASASSAWAGTCSLCREVLQSTGNPNLIKGYYFSIILLVGISTAVLVVVARYAWKSYR